MTKRKTLTIAGISLAAVITGLGITAAAIPAVAQTESSTSTSTEDCAGGGSRGAGEEELTGDTAEQVEAAVLAEYPDATIVRKETDADGAAYEAHIRQADGTRATVKLDESFAITATETGGPGGRHGDGPRGNGGPRGGSAPSSESGDTDSGDTGSGDTDSSDATGSSTS